MLYICKHCRRRPEEIVGDDAPKCMVCGAPMIRATLSYKELLIRPGFVIDRMQKIVETYGRREASSGRRFRQEREAWSAALWALGLAETDQQEYWVEIETIERTPDAKVHRLDQSTGRNIQLTYNFEIVDWEEHVDDLMQVIQQKCERAYPADFGLLILGRSGKFIDPFTIWDAIRGMRVPFAAIWIVGLALEDPNKVEMAKLFPDISNLGYDVRRALQRDRLRKDVLRREGRGTSTEFRDMGDIYLPIP